VTAVFRDALGKFVVSMLLMASVGTTAQSTPDGFTAVANSERAKAVSRSDSARVVFMGDSITASWADEPFFVDNPHFVNRGIGGQTAPT